MQKIGFNQRYGLQKAVLDGTKTMTRRLEKPLENAVKYYRDSYSDMPAFNIISQRYSERGGIEIQLESDFLFIPTRYKLNEIVAVAQSYKELDYSFHGFATNPSRTCGIRKECAEKQKGWGNKMFVSSKFMPHHIRITDIMVERLQDISDDDCIKEGVYRRIERHPRQEFEPEFTHGEAKYHARNPRAAFAALIDKVSGKGTWNRNPWVFVYTFKLVK